MTPREQLEQRLKGWGIEPDPKLLDRYKIKVGPLETLDCGPVTFYRDPKVGRLLYEALVRREANRIRKVTFDGLRWKSESGALYPVSDPENGAEVAIQRGLAKYELPSFSFVFWPATEVDGEIYVGDGKFRVKFPKDGDKADLEFFLRQVALADRFRARAAELAAEDRPALSAADETGSAKVSDTETQQWFENLSHVTAFSQAPKATPKSALETSTSTADDSATLPNSSAPVAS